MKKYESISFDVPKTVAKQAERGLELHKRFKRGGTAVGVRRASQMAGQETLSASTIRRTHSFFARHEVDKKADGWGSRTKPSNGYIAWLLWGGDAGKRWADGLVKRMDKEDEKRKDAKSKK